MPTKDCKSKFRFETLAILLMASILVLPGCGKDKGSKAGASVPRQANDSVVIKMAGETGKTVFDLSQKEHKVEYMKTSGGVFIKGIDSIVSGDNYGWVYSVNGVMARVAADKYITGDTDRIEWHFRKF